MTTTSAPAAASGTFSLGGDLDIVRLGFGAMRITGDGIWGEPADHDGCIATLKRIPELGITFIDTADSYGPYVSEDLIKEALHPYDGLIIGTKAGLTRAGAGDWRPVGRPEYLRQCTEMSLRRLGVEALDLQQLHRIDAQVPLADQVGELKMMQDEGKIKHIGLSECTVDQLHEAQKIATIVSVQSMYNLSDVKTNGAMLDECEKQGIGFIPWAPVSGGSLAKPGGILDTLSKEHGSTSSQLALAWLLKRSPVMLPIPGTSQVSHLEENVAAAGIELTDAQFEAISKAAA